MAFCKNSLGGGMWKALRVIGFFLSLGGFKTSGGCTSKKKPEVLSDTRGVHSPPDSFLKALMRFLKPPKRQGLLLHALPRPTQKVCQNTIRIHFIKIKKLGACRKSTECRISKNKKEIRTAGCDCESSLHSFYESVELALLHIVDEWYNRGKRLTYYSEIRGTYHGKEVIRNDLGRTVAVVSYFLNGT